MPATVKIYCLVFALVTVAACVSVSRVVTGDDGKEYQQDKTTLLGVTVSETRKPIVTAQQMAIDDARKAKEQARTTYRRIAMFCALAAIICAVVGCTTSFREAGGAAWILGAASVVCMWVSLTVTNPWVIAGGVLTMGVAAAVHFKLLDFDLIKAIKGRHDG